MKKNSSSDASFIFPATDVANLREKLERFEGGSGSKALGHPGGASLGAERINTLQHQLQTVRKQDSELRKELEDVKHANIQLQAKVTALEYENDKALERTSVALRKSLTAIWFSDLHLPNSLVFPYRIAVVPPLSFK